ncbi:FGGY-family carbohydrate kinase [Mahella australiensis]|uniref:FGGY-family carbohydrate kinase n=1 Tax=Mahella australiensis TaxID=252966 RepID=UPI00030A7B4F|nr:FGGY-family carbohydrate kinase [Mahella australiensis]
MEYMSQAGMFINEIRAVGGGAKSPKGLQLKADIVKHNICTLQIREAACLGAAILAGTACGAYRSVDEGVERTVAINEVYMPNYRACNIYDKRYNIYKDLYHTLKSINRQL